MQIHVFLLFALLLCDVLVRALTGSLHVLPKIFNVIDIPIAGALFLVYLSRRGSVRPPWWQPRITRCIFGFCAVLLVGMLLNPDYIFPEAVASQWIMLLEPLLVFIAIVNLPLTEEHVDTYSRLYNRLLIFEVVVGVLQVPRRIAAGDTELVCGTFRGNAEQYAAILLIAMFYLIASAVLYPKKKKKYMAAIILILVLDVAIDNKASWLGVAIAIGVMVWRLDLVRIPLLRIFGPILFIGGIGVFIALVASHTSDTSGKFTKIVDALRTGKFHSLGKVKAYYDIARSDMDNPYMILVGAGPSNFYSRASRQFYLSPSRLGYMYSNPDMLQDASSSDEPAEVRTKAGKASNSLGGAMSITTMMPYYYKFYGSKQLIYAVGTIQVDSPFSPYAGLLGETGLIGTLLYLGIYGRVLRKLWSWLPVYRDDATVFPMLLSSCGFMIYLLVNSIYGPFLETTRYTTILWSMVGLVTVYVELRQQSEQTEAELAEELMEDEPGPYPALNPARGARAL